MTVGIIAKVIVTIVVNMIILSLFLCSSIRLHTMIVVVVETLLL
jgi:hypothetical protein